MPTLTKHIARIACLVCVGLAGAHGAAHAEDLVRPGPPRVFYVPTAYLQPPRQVYGTIGAHASAGGLGRTGSVFALSTGLGRLAEIDVEVADYVGVCEECTEDDQVAAPLFTASALFKMGLEENRFGSWQPALAVGYRAMLQRRDRTEFEDFRAARLYGVASKEVGPLRLHAGVDIWDTEITVGGQRSTLSEDRALADRVRPFGGLAWTPGDFPRTSVLLDFSFAPVVDDTPGTPAIADRGPDLRWLFCWGARYQATGWASIELGVRHRQGDTLGDSTVMIRLNALYPTTAPTRARRQPGGQKR